jgi:tripartite-type tricarboxylate transporter receptor subunit TctC
LKLSRHQFLHLGAGAAAVPATSRIAWSQTYPARPVRIIVGTPPSSGADIAARIMGQWLSERLGQRFIIENRPGAGTNIATEAVVRATPDGYTHLFVATSNTINATLYEKLNFVFLRDIAPVAGLSRSPFFWLVNPSFPINTIPELIAFAKSNPNKLNVGGANLVQQVAVELFKTMAGIHIVYVAYRADSLGLTDLMGGHLEMYLGGPAAMEHIKTGRARALAVTGATRSQALPPFPTVAETVPGYEASSFYGIGAPNRALSRCRNPAASRLPLPRHSPEHAA